MTFLKYKIDKDVFLCIIQPSIDSQFSMFFHIMMSLTDALRLKKAQYQLNKQQKLQKKIEKMIYRFITRIKNNKENGTPSKAISSPKNLNQAQLLENLVGKAHVIYNPWYEIN